MNTTKEVRPKLRTFFEKFEEEKEKGKKITDKIKRLIKSCQKRIETDLRSTGNYVREDDWFKSLKGELYLLKDIVKDVFTLNKLQLLIECYDDDKDFINQINQTIKVYEDEIIVHNVIYEGRADDPHSSYYHDDDPHSSYYHNDNSYEDISNEARVRFINILKDILENKRVNKRL